MQTFTLRGRVQDRNGAPVNAQVEVDAWNGEMVATAVTDGTGNFNVRFAGPGPFMLAVTAGEVATTVPVQLSNPDMIVTLENLHAPPAATSHAATVSVNDLMATPKARSKLDAALKAFGKLKFSQAWKHVNEAIAAAPRWGQPYYVRGLMNLQNRSYSDAEADLSAAVKANPDNAGALTVLGNVCLNQGQDQMAEFYLRRAIAMPPVRWQADVDLAQLDLKHGNYKEAQSLAGDALAANPPGPIEVLVLAGQAAGAQGDWQAAADSFSQYLDKARPGAMDVDLANRGLARAEDELRAAAVTGPRSTVPFSAPASASAAVEAVPLTPAAPAAHAPSPAANPASAAPVLLASNPPERGAGAPADCADCTGAGGIASAATPAGTPESSGLDVCAGCARVDFVAAHVPEAPVETHAAALSNGIYRMRADVSDVRVQVTVMDSGHHVVGHLPAGDFELLEDGVPQKIESFEFTDSVGVTRPPKDGVTGPQKDVATQTRKAARNDLDAPIAAGLLLDASGSMLEERRAVNRAATSFLNSTKPADQVFLATFNDEYSVAAPFTNNVAQLREALNTPRGQGGTALYDAILSGLATMRAAPTRGKQVLVVVTDGEDDDSRHSLDQLLALLQAPDAPLVYCIGVGSESDAASSEVRQALKSIAESTGGLAYFPPSPRDLDAVMNEVNRAMRAQYTLIYRSNRVGSGFRPITVKVQDKKHKDLFAVARTGYAETAPSQSAVASAKK